MPRALRRLIIGFNLRDELSDLLHSRYEFSHDPCEMYTYARLCQYTCAAYRCSTVVLLGTCDFVYVSSSTVWDSRGKHVDRAGLFNLGGARR